jgi:hypothetical protein
MQKIVNKLITSSIKDVDVYRWKNATWLIFTDETRWVVEMTNEGTLWYNYKFFKDIFKYVSITVGTEMDGYIIQWANEYFFKVSTLRSIANNPEKDRSYTEKVLENGIKDTQGRGKNHGDEFEWHTRAVIDNGIKEVNNSDSIHRKMRAENLVPRIIKNAKPNIEYSEQTGVYDPDCNGNKTEIWRIVEEIKPSIWTTKRGVDIHDLMCSGNTTDISSITKNGIKNIYPDQNSGDDGYNWSNEFEADKVIEGGIKVIPLPTIKDLRGYSDYYNTKEDRTMPHTEYVKDAIEGGVKL